MALEATAASQAIPRHRDRGPVGVWSDEQLLGEFLECGGLRHRFGLGVHGCLTLRDRLHFFDFLEQALE